MGVPSNGRLRAPDGQVSCRGPVTTAAVIALGRRGATDAAKPRPCRPASGSTNSPSSTATRPRAVAKFEDGREVLRLIGRSSTQVRPSYGASLVDLLDEDDRKGR